MTEHTNGPEAKQVSADGGVANREIPFGRPLIGPEERQAVLDVLDGPILVHGPQSQEFEESFSRYTDAPHAVSVSSCTAAMHLIWFVLGIGRGDEVVVSAQTHVATAHAVEATGAKAVFADSEAGTGNVDPQAVEAAITPRTRGIAVVHYLGEPADMPALRAIADRHGLFLLEDCALAIGTRIEGTHAGLLGDAGCFSFYPVKHMTTAEGGMIITRDGDLASTLSRRRAFGVDRTVGERAIPGIYDVPALGLNYRMNELQAAIGISQVAKLDDFLAARSRNYDALAKELAGLEGAHLVPASTGRTTSSWYCAVLLLDDELADVRFEVVQGLKSRNIGTSTYYPRPVPHLGYYADTYGYTEDQFPTAARYSYQGIALPVGPHLNTDDMAYVAEGVVGAMEEAKGLL